MGRERLGSRPPHERIGVCEPAADEFGPRLVPARQGRDRFHRVHADKPRVVRQRRRQRRRVEPVQQGQGPHRAGPVVFRRRRAAKQLHDGGIATASLHELLHRQPPDSLVRVSESFRQRGGGELRQIRGHRQIDRRRPGLARPHDPPNPAAFAVAARVLQVHLVVADDAVVEVGDVQPAIRPKLQVHGSKPEIVAGQEVGRLLRPRRRAPPGDRVGVHPAVDDVADERQVAVRGGKSVRVADRHRPDAGRAVVIGRRVGRLPEPVLIVEVGPREHALIAASGQEQRQRSRMAVGVEPVSKRVEGHAEGVHLPPGDLLDGRAIGPEAVGVARVQLEDDVPFTAELHARLVAEAMVRIHPAVGAEAERVLVAMRVAEIEWPVEHFPQVGRAVVIRVGQFPDVRDRPDDRRGLSTRRPWQRQDADRDVELVGEQRRFPGPAVGAEVLEDRQPVPGLLVGGRRKRIFHRVRHPEPAPGVEGHVHRLLDLRLCRDQLDVEARRKFELCPLRFRGQRFRIHDRGRGSRERGEHDHDDGDRQARRPARR